MHKVTMCGNLWLETSGLALLALTDAEKKQTEPCRSDCWSRQGQLTLPWHSPGWWAASGSPPGYSIPLVSRTWYQAAADPRRKTHLRSYWWHLVDEIKYNKFTHSRSSSCSLKPVSWFITKTLSYQYRNCYHKDKIVTGPYLIFMTKNPWKDCVDIKMVDFLIGHYTYRMFPPAIDIIPTSLAVVYSNGKYTNYKN